MTSWRVDHVARRLVRLAAEHGVPNSFACAEIADGGRVLAANQVGLVGRRLAQDLASALRDRFAEFTVEYHGRRFHLAPVAADGEGSAEAQS